MIHQRKSIKPNDPRRWRKSRLQKSDRRTALLAAKQHHLSPRISARRLMSSGLRNNEVRIDAKEDERMDEDDGECQKKRDVKEWVTSAYKEERRQKPQLKP